MSQHTETEEEVTFLNACAVELVARLERDGNGVNEIIIILTLALGVVYDFSFYNKQETRNAFINRIKRTMLSQTEIRGDLAPLILDTLTGKVIRGD